MPIVYSVLFCGDGEESGVLDVGKEIYLYG